MLARARPHDGGSADDGDFTFRFTRASQFLTQLANDSRLRLVRVDHRVDELKNVGARGRSLHRDDANALVANDNLVTFVHIEKLHRSSRALLSIKRDRAVHHRGPHLDLFAVESDKCLLIGRDIEVVRENAIVGRLRQLHVSAFHRLGAVLPQAEDQFIELFARLRGDFNSRETLIRPLLPDLYLSDLEAGAARQNLIQHLGQDQRIDDVTA